MRIGYVVDNAAGVPAPSAGDVILRDLLTLYGHVVTYIADSAAAPTDQDVLIIADSGAPADLGSKYDNLPYPLICMDVGLIDDMGWSSANGTNGGGSGTDWDILAVDHGVVAGQPDPAPMKTAGAIARWGVTTTALGSGVQRIAQSVADWIICFAYPRGSTRQDATVAEARQVFVPFTETWLIAMNSGQQRLHLEAVRWAVEFQGWGSPM